LVFIFIYKAVITICICNLQFRIATKQFYDPDTIEQYISSVMVAAILHLYYISSSVTPF